MRHTYYCFFPFSGFCWFKLAAIPYVFFKDPLLELPCVSISPIHKITLVIGKLKRSFYHNTAAIAATDLISRLVKQDSQHSGTALAYENRRIICRNAAAVLVHRITASSGVLAYRALSSFFLLYILSSATL